MRGLTENARPHPLGGRGRVSLVRTGDSALVFPNHAINALASGFLSRHPASMYLMYVDESGDTGLVDSPTRYFALSGIIVHESAWRQFLERLIAFRKTLRSVYGLPVRAEIHTSTRIISYRISTRARYHATKTRSGSRR